MLELIALNYCFQILLDVICINALFYPFYSLKIPFNISNEIIPFYTWNV